MRWSSSDWSVGEILAALDRLKLTGNTIVILTSDNGPVIDDLPSRGISPSKSSAHLNLPVRFAAANTASLKEARGCRSSCAGQVAPGP